MVVGSLRPVFASGECEIDLAQRELRVLGSPVPVGARAFEIVEVLVQSAGELVTKDELINRVWPGAIVNDNALQVHISAVRKALGPNRAMLTTVSGRGYRLLGGWTARDRRAVTAVVPQQLRVFEKTRATNIPGVSTTLIGRSTAVQRLRDLASAYRVVTLTGPGGIGKTTLAMQVASGLLGDFEGAVWLVELASLSDPDLVPTAVASVLGLRLGGEGISAEAVARAVGDTDLLLVLDNCEHVIDAAANFAETLVRMCPRATILATSRETLRIDGEYVYRVLPLEVPAVGEEEPDQILSRSAIELFIARAKALGSGFSPQPEALPAISAICRHLDGIPLAIEFAAAQAATLGVQEVAAGLHDRFTLLVRGRRTALPRHQTLRATLDWSYELLPEVERLLLRRLAVFPAGFTLDAAAAVVADIELDVAAVTDRVANLIAKSLVMQDKSERNIRWYLLETTRAYALEKLAESGEEFATARRHAEYFWNLVVPNGAEPTPTLAIEDARRHADELDNIRAALDWSLSPEGDAAIGVALSAAFAPVWIHLSLIGECRTRAEQALGMLQPDLQLSKGLECRLLMALGVALIITMGPVEQTRNVIAKARQLAVDTADREVHVRMLAAQWSMECNMGEYAAALSTVHQLAELVRLQNDDVVPFTTDRFLGFSLLRVGDLAGARDCLERMVHRYVAPSNSHHTELLYFGQHVMARTNLAQVLALHGYLDQARQEVALSLDESREADKLTLLSVLLHGAVTIGWMTGDFAAAGDAVDTINDLASRLDATYWKILGACWKGKLLIARGEFTSGCAVLRESLDICERSGWRTSSALFLGDFACGLAGLGRFDEAVVAVERALVQAESSREHWCQAELFRIKGDILRQQGADNEALAEDCFWSASQLARAQGALFWELRIALSLARLRLVQGRRDEAWEILSPVYDKFTEGFQTADLRAARSVLDTLSS
jgi:predicted ATPase/DNA-binding winged helix-turn-helix (wHTH) protein